MALQTRKTTEIPAVLSCLFFLSGFLRVWVTVDFTAPQYRRILDNHIPAAVDPLELCSGSRKLPHHGDNYALPFYVSFHFVFFWVYTLRCHSTLYDGSVGPL